MAKLNVQQIVNGVEAKFLKTEIPPVRIGDNVKVGVKIIEGSKNEVCAAIQARQNGLSGTQESSSHVPYGHLLCLRGWPGYRAAYRLL